ncbi:MAG: carbohydrate binding domain-containing protein [Pirellulaceae bacterium]
MAVALQAIGEDVAGAVKQVPEQEAKKTLELEKCNRATAISPLLFGHNLETTRRGVWQGLGAERVANRKFAADLKRWTVVGPGATVSIDATLGYAGGKSACIKVPAGGVPCGIAQTHDWLALKPGTKYNLRIWVKSAEERRCDVTFGKLHQTLAAAKGDWQLLHVEGTAAGDEARLEIASAEPGTFWIGAVSLQPADAFWGMRRDVIDCLKRLKPGTLRWPGGCYVEFYRWKEGLLPVDQRPPIGPSGQWWLLPENDDYDPHEIGIDEFIALCREVGSEPAITVRMSEVTPEDAAGLVEYCNGGTNTKWGKIRAEKGHPEPYRVEYWFLGNELYSFGRGGLDEAATCAERTREFAQAMKQVDPAIRRIGCTRVNEAWDKTLLERAGDSFELCSVHDYRIGELFSAGSPAGIQSLYDEKYAQPEQLSTILRWAREGLPPLFKKVRAPLTFDEWNIHWTLHGSVGMGLYTATVLNLLCREAGPYGIESAYFFMPVNEGAIQVTPVAAEMDVAGLVFEMFGGHQGNRLVVPPAADPMLDLCASIGARGDRFWVTAINTDLQKEQTLEVTVPEGCRQKEIVVTLLVPESLVPSARTFRREQRVLKADAKHRVSLTIPPCTIVAAGGK